MDLNFEIFMVVLLIISILVVGRFLQDGSSNYLEGTLLVVGTFTYLDWCPPLPTTTAVKSDHSTR
jgi:Ca2+/H+ antiporter